MENYYTEVALNNRVLLEVIGLIIVYIGIPVSIIVWLSMKIHNKGEKSVNKMNQSLSKLTASLMPTKKEFNLELVIAPEIKDIAWNTRTEKYATDEDFEHEPGNLIAIPEDMGEFISSRIHNDYFVLYTFENGLAMVGYDINEQQQVACVHKCVIEADGFEHAVHLLEEEMEMRAAKFYENL